MKSIYKTIIGIGLTLGGIGYIGKHYHNYIEKNKETTKKEALKDIGAGLATIAGVTLYSREMIRNTKNLEGDLKE